MATETATPDIKLEITSTPHVHGKWSTKKAMWMVVASLVPCVIAAAVFYGWYPLVMIAVSIGAAVGTEAAIKSIRKKRATIGDGSAVITGLLLALILPPNFSLVFTAMGSIFAVAVGKELFGGLGYNIFNPALVGRAFLQAAFPVPMTTWVIPNFAVDGVTTATPLSIAKFGDEAARAGLDLGSMFFGNIGGSIGETSALAILLGGGFLIAIGIVNWRVPLSMTVGVLVFGGIFWIIDPVTYQNPLFHLFAGGFMFGALYMASDWVTSPLTAKGTWIFGLMIALIIVVIRLFGGLPEGVMYAILIMNGFVPLINRYTRPAIFGEAK